MSTTTATQSPAVMESYTMIATRHGVSAWAVMRAAKAIGLKPTQKIGNTNVFDRAAIRRIDAELHRVRQATGRRADAVGA